MTLSFIRPDAVGVRTALRRGGRDAYAALAASAVLHVAAFGGAWLAHTVRPAAPALVMMESRLVRWAPRTADPRMLPRLAQSTDPTARDVPDAPAAAAPPPRAGNAADGTPAVAAATKPKPADKPGRTAADPAPLTDTEREKAMQRSLARIRARRGAVDDAGTGSPDGSVYGTLSAGARQTLASAYARQLIEAFAQNYVVPLTIPEEARRALRVTIAFELDPAGAGGTILRPRVTKPSGEALFDSAALQAVRKTTRVPLPAHEEIRNLVLSNGLSVIFRGDDLR